MGYFLIMEKKRVKKNITFVIHLGLHHHVGRVLREQQ